MGAHEFSSLGRFQPNRASRGHVVPAYCVKLFGGLTPTNAHERMFARAPDAAGVRRWPSGRLVGPAAVLGVELARRVLGVTIDVAVAAGPHEHGDSGDAAGDPDGAPDRVGQGRERQRADAQVRSTTIVLTEAVTPSATSTTTT